MEWSGTEWRGQLPFSNVKRPPPQGCNSRALWLGYESWTAGGEGVALRLDRPLQSGHQYTFGFTYCKDGVNQGEPDSGVGFGPIAYTASKKPERPWQGINVGRLPSTFDWRTDSIIFTAAANQDGHQWLILHTVETSGLILSSCAVHSPIENNFLDADTTLCNGTGLVLSAVSGPAYTYTWNTGETNRSINVSTPGIYSVVVKNHHCETKDSIAVYYDDCTPRMIMPNIFTPNGDPFNEMFAPKEHNYIDSGAMEIYNRWGEQVYSGDLFAGWNGAGASTGTYFYRIIYIDRKMTVHKQKGTVTLAR